MSEYRLSNEAKDDLIRIFLYGVNKFGIKQAESYYNTFFDYFEIIANNPFSFESVDFVKPGYRRGVCGAETIYFIMNNDTAEIMIIVGRQDLNTLIAERNL